MLAMAQSNIIVTTSFLKIFLLPRHPTLRNILEFYPQVHRILSSR